MSTHPGPFHRYVVDLGQACDLRYAVASPATPADNAHLKIEAAFASLTAATRYAAILNTPAAFSDAIRAAGAR